MGPITGLFEKLRDHGPLAPWKTKAPDILRWPMASKVAKDHRNLGILQVAGDKTPGKSFKKSVFGGSLRPPNPPASRKTIGFGGFEICHPPRFRGVDDQPL